MSTQYFDSRLLSVGAGGNRPGEKQSSKHMCGAVQGSLKNVDSHNLNKCWYRCSALIIGCDTYNKPKTNVIDVDGKSELKITYQETRKEETTFTLDPHASNHHGENSIVE
jgi:hypothetical protein